MHNPTKMSRFTELLCRFDQAVAKQDLQNTTKIVKERATLPRPKEKRWEGKRRGMTGWTSLILTIWQWNEHRDHVIMHLERREENMNGYYRNLLRSYRRRRGWRRWGRQLIVRMNRRLIYIQRESDTTTTKGEERRRHEERDDSLKFLDSDHLSMEWRRNKQILHPHKRLCKDWLTSRFPRWCSTLRDAVRCPEVVSSPIINQFRWAMIRGRDDIQGTMRPSKPKINE